MPDPVQLRDSTQIVLARDALDDVDATVDERFVVTITDAGADDEYCRIVGSPVEIKKASAFLARNGIPIQ
jgi:hypothetical protein